MPEGGVTGLSLLIVEDEAMLRRRLMALFERLGAEVLGADSLAAARAHLAAEGFDFVLLDVNLPDGEGTSLIAEIPPSTGVVVMTARGSVIGAVEVMRSGALDYLVKPFEDAQVEFALDRARKARQLARVEAHRREESAGGEVYFGEVLAGLQSQLEKMLAADLRVKRHLPPILIEGETGTGKTTIARWIHARGPRAGAELVEVNCSALPESLAESELFGHERGAFTDAKSARIGLFEAAHGGTLFLDELSSLSIPLQAKVLTAIEDHKIRRIGATRPVEIDVRVIAASNRDLKDLVAQGLFREDLLHRLDLYRVRIAPLRERGQDILRLAERFIRQLSRKHRIPLRRISAAGEARLLQHAWPGNVRELAHELERAVVFEEGPQLEFPGLAAPPGMPPTNPGTTPQGLINRNYRFPAEGSPIEERVLEIIQMAIDQSEGNITAAARLLGVNRDYLRYRLGMKTSKSDPPSPS